MSNRVSRLATSLKQLGDVQVNNWDFAGLMHKDIGEIEIGRSLRRLGNVRVMEWDFRSVMPAVNRLAHQEVDLVDLFKRTAQYKVMEWDFRTAMSHDRKSVTPEENRLCPEEMQALKVRLKDFLQYVTVSLIDQPEHAQIKVREIAPDVLRFKLVLVQRDVAMLIGRQGHTAAAIRKLLKTSAGIHGVQALLQIHSHEEEIAFIFDPENGDQD